MQVTDELVRSIVQDVLGAIQGNGVKSRLPVSRHAPRSMPHVPRPTVHGIFDDVSAAVAAAVAAQLAFERLGLEARRKAVQCIRRICVEGAEALGKMEFDETKIGRLEHKIEKLKVIGDRIPGVEFLRTDAVTGENGVTLTEYAPFGVIGAVTPVTHSLPTLAANAISMLAAGNAVVFNPHPSGAKVACHGTQLFNRAIHETIGIDNLITIIGEPTLKTAHAIFEHADVKLLCVTGGPAVGRAALRSSKRAIVAGPGNPPVVVDETADLDNAARSIVAGATYDNNLLCIGEKEVFAVDAIFDELCRLMTHHKAVMLDAKQVEMLTRVAFGPEKEDRKKLVLNKDLIGQDAAVLADKAGFKVPAGTLLLFGETTETNPFVPEEQMMPFVPFVRVPDVDTAIALAKKYEHGFKHTAIIHSRNVDTITRMGRELDTSLYIQNGPSMAGLGSGGEGYLSFSIATPTGEGVTTPLTFTRQRRSTTVGSMRVL